MLLIQRPVVVLRQFGSEFTGLTKSSTLCHKCFTAKSRSIYASAAEEATMGQDGKQYWGSR